MDQDKPPYNPIVHTHKDFGASFFVENVPNGYERMWMVARAINFDVENYTVHSVFVLDVAIFYFMESRMPRIR